MKANEERGRGKDRQQLKDERKHARMQVSKKERKKGGKVIWMGER